MEQQLQQTLMNLLAFTNETIQNQALDLPVRTEAVQKLATAVKTLVDATTAVGEPQREIVKHLQDLTLRTQDLQQREIDMKARALLESAKITAAQETKNDQRKGEE